MKKFLLAGAVVVFAGVAATGAMAADHKASKPAAPHHAAVVTPAKSTVLHKESAPKHHAAKHHKAHAHKTHAK
jgi:hypothetical protein